MATSLKRNMSPTEGRERTYSWKAIGTEASNHRVSKRGVTAMLFGRRSRLP